MRQRFDNSVVFITGGGAGIGKATAELFLAEGARVAILDLDTAQAAPGCECYQGSVTDDAAVTAAVDAVASRHGRIDILVNNAGVSFLGTVEEGTLDDWARVLDINLVSVARVLRAALPHLRKSSHAAIVNVASCLAQTGLARRALYSATKGGVEALSRAMAADLVGEGQLRQSRHRGHGLRPGPRRAGRPRHARIRGTAGHGPYGHGRRGGGRHRLSRPPRRPLHRRLRADGGGGLREHAELIVPRNSGRGEEALRSISARLIGPRSGRTRHEAGPGSYLAYSPIAGLN